MLIVNVAVPPSVTLTLLIVIAGTVSSSWIVPVPCAVAAATFVAPWGPVVPILAIGVSMAVVAGATRPQLLGGLAALGAGAALFAANSFSRTSPRE